MNSKEFQKKYAVNRKNSDCAKWDSKEAQNKIPMWVADADFKSPEKVTECLIKRLQHGAFGYGSLPEDYFDEMIKWNKKVNGVTYKKETIRFSKGAVDGLNQIIRSLTKEKDPILITSPVYHPFRNTIKATKRVVVDSPLKKVSGNFEINFSDLEEKIKKNKVKMMILCSPHNPVGRVWTKKELTTLFAITHKYNVLVVSDEVHCELIMPGYKFIPSLSFKKYENEIITLNAESKTFSLAMFNHCHVIIPNKKLRDKFDVYQEDYHISKPNALNGLSSYYSYKYGYEWLTGFIDTINENYKYMVKELKDYCDFPRLEGTYLLYADFSKSIKKGTAYDFLYDKCDIYPNAGELFGKGYEKWARINLATPLSNVKKACNNIKKALKDTK